LGCSHGSSNKSSVVLVIVVFAVFFALLSFTAFPYYHVLTQPTISQDRAFDIITSDIKAHFKNVYEFEVYTWPNHASPRYIPLEQYTADGMKLPLYYLSSNSTLYIINGSNYKIWWHCNLVTDTKVWPCNGFPDSTTANAIRGRLVYITDMAYDSTSAGHGAHPSYVDANTGEIVLSPYRYHNQ
jgi:hypothetical protein